MSYEVVILPEAENLILVTARWWAKHRSLDQAQRWFHGIYDALDTLERNPERCPLARENSLFPIELRELHYGVGPHPTHRAVFTVRPNAVVILTLRHTSQADLQPEDLGFTSELGGIALGRRRGHSMVR